MKKYRLVASISEENSTVQGLYARTDFHANVLACNIISNKSVSDERFEKGDIKLINDVTGKDVWISDERLEQIASRSARKKKGS